MNEMPNCLLLDGALLREHTLLDALKQSGAGRALYADLGTEAQQVGPWLWPDKALTDIGVLDLPTRHGVSEIRYATTLQGLMDHFARIRYVETHDAQRYFLRHADMRAVRAMRAALNDAQWRFLVGPITHWSYIDRQGISDFIVREALTSDRQRVDSLRLSSKQLAMLLDAGLPDQLCLAVEELQEEGLHPDADPAQYASVEAAARLVSQEGIESYPLQSAIARQAVLHGVQAVESAEFVRVVRMACLKGEADSINAWSPGQAANAPMPKTNQTTGEMTP